MTLFFDPALGLIGKNFGDRKMILDLNMKSIGFPADMYDFLFMRLAEFGMSECAIHEDYTQCLFSKDISKLPEIKFNMKTGPISTILFKIYPPDYIREGNFTPSNAVALNIIKLDPAKYLKQHLY